MNLLKRLWTEEEGQGMAEYGLILALVSVIAIGALYALGGELSDVFGDVKDKLTNPPNDVD